MLSVALVGQRVRPAYCGGGRLGTQKRRLLCEQLLSKVHRLQIRADGCGEAGGGLGGRAGGRQEHGHPVNTCVCQAYITICVSLVKTKIRDQHD